MEELGWIFSAILVLIGAVDVYAAVRTLRAIEKQASLMEEQTRIFGQSVEAAGNSATAAIQNSQTAINTARPFVFFRPSEVKILIEKDEHGALKQYVFWIPLENLGNTPATRMIIWVNVYPTETVLAADFNYPDHGDTGKPPQRLVLGPKAVIDSSGLVVSRDVMSQVTQHTMPDSQDRILLGTYSSGHNNGGEVVVQPHGIWPTQRCHVSGRAPAEQQTIPK